MRIPVLFCFLVAIASSLAFVTRQPEATHRLSSSNLFGISEWRDMMFDYPGTRNNNNLGTESSGPAPKEVCILPFSYNEVLLQGETKQLRLYEDRMIQLFEHAMEHNCGVVAMGLISQSGLIQTVPICEIEAYNRMEGFGIFVTIRVVGRAKLMEVAQKGNFLKAVCTEINDSISPNLELPNLVASNIENFMLLLSSMEDRLEQAMEESEDEDSASMKRRIQVAKLEDRFYDDLGDDEDEEVSDMDRRGRFRQAYQVAMSTDTQGYCVATNKDLERSPQELTALSWAAFCANLFPEEEEDAKFRIQALDSESLFDRLKLASHMLREKKNQLKSQMEKAGLKLKGGEFDEEF